MTPIQPQGTRPPLFCVHPASGLVNGYVNLARLLGLDQPVYGLRDPAAPYRPGHRYTSIGDIADRYVEALLRQQPGKPYHLVGWSFGGLIAFEIACRLRRLGREIGLLGILDASVPEAGAPPIDAAAIVHGNASFLARKAGTTLSLSLEEFRQLPPDVQIERLFHLLSAQGALGAEATLERFRVTQEMDVDRRRVLREYVPSRYDRPVDLFVAEETELESRKRHDPRTGQPRDRTFGWAPYATGGITRWIIPGAAHFNLVSEPHAMTLAIRIAQRLRRRSAAPRLARVRADRTVARLT